SRLLTGLRRTCLPPGYCHEHSESPIHPFRVGKDGGDVGLEQHDIDSLPVAFVILATDVTPDVILVPHFVLRRVLTLRSHTSSVLSASPLGRRSASSPRSALHARG